MKRYILFILVFVLLAFTTNTAKSQQAWKHQINPEIGYAIPYGSFTDAIDLQGGPGIGATYYFQFLENRKLFFSAYAGYFFQFPIDQDFGGDIESHISILPITLGARYNFNLSGFQPYIGLEFGIFTFSTTIEGAGLDNTESETYTGIIPKIGFRYPIVKQIDFDLNIKAPFIFISDNSTARDEDLYQQIGLNVGIAYTIGKNPTAR